MLKRQGHGKAVDWYLLGVLMYEMLIGIPPYYAHSKKQLFENIRSAPLKLPKNLKRSTKSLLKGVIFLAFEFSLVLKLLARNPAKRLGSGP
jgi:serine/threonine protein kinase